MTAFVRAFVFCDSCGQPLDNSTVPAAPTVTEARREARRSGWVIKRRGRDLCEGCARSADSPAP